MANSKKRVLFSLRKHSLQNSGDHFKAVVEHLKTRKILTTEFFHIMIKIELQEMKIKAREAILLDLVKS